MDSGRASQQKVHVSGELELSAPPNDLWEDKTLTQQGLIFQIDEHEDVPGGWHPERAWKLCAPSPIPCLYILSPCYSSVSFVIFIINW
jgi:hypothetical protein